MKLFSILKTTITLLTPIALVATAGWYFKNESDFFLVKEVPVEIEYDQTNFPMVQTIKPLILEKQKALFGKNIWSLGLTQIRSDFLESDRVQDVEIRRHFPNKLSLLVKVNKVVFIYADKKNNLFPITENASVTSKISPTSAPHAPLFRNTLIAEDPLRLRKVIELFAEVPKINSLQLENIASVDFQDVTGLSLRLIDNDETIYLGQDHIATKGLQVVRVLEYLKSQKQKARVIDASFSKKVLVRLRKRS